MFLVSFVIVVALITVLSGIGVAEHCGVGSGGVYSMISSVLGGRTGGTIGLLYVLGQVSVGSSSSTFSFLSFLFCLWATSKVLRAFSCLCAQESFLRVLGGGGH